MSKFDFHYDAGHGWLKVHIYDAGTSVSMRGLHSLQLPQWRAPLPRGRLRRRSLPPRMGEGTA
jgi:hypothetical protein